MITAKNFASLGSVWHVVVPSLEQFTRWVNSHQRSYSHPVPRTGEANRSALISETAFGLATSSTGGAIPEVRARELLDRLPGSTQDSSPLTSTEMGEARMLARNLQRAIPPIIDDAIIHPLYPGCGVVGPAFGDLRQNAELIEVKTVERGFRSLDFRQALTYAALAYAAGDEIERITLVNPRRALHFSSTSTALARDLGAVSWFDLMQNVVNAMTEVGPSQ